MDQLYFTLSHWYVAVVWAPVDAWNALVPAWWLPCTTTFPDAVVHVIDPTPNSLSVGRSTKLQPKLVNQIDLGQSPRGQRLFHLRLLIGLFTIETDFNC